MEEQKDLYAKGRTTMGVPCKCLVQPCRNHPLGYRVTNAKPGDSLHHYGCAIDVCISGPDPYLEKDPQEAFLWQEFGRVAKSWGMSWGGDWRGSLVDRPHIELTYGLTKDEIRELYSDNGIQAVWAVFDKIRGVPEGQDWYGPQSTEKLIEFGHRVG